jgi:hypothetical protein
VFHVELRQFPHVARAFNLTAEELQAQVVSRWIADQPISLQDRRWDPGRAKLTIYEARELASEEMGLGRGWGTVSREGENVTERALTAAHTRRHEGGFDDDLKAAILARAEEGPLNMTQVLDLAGRIHSDQAADELVRLVAGVVLELLRDGSLELSRPG